jgi:hypothetical protein
LAYLQKANRRRACQVQAKRCDYVRKKVRKCDAEIAKKLAKGGGLHSLTFQLNLSRV